MPLLIHVHSDNEKKTTMGWGEAGTAELQG